MSLSLVALMMMSGSLAPKWELTFAQEFDGPSGQAPDPKVWVRDLGGGGFGNNEWQSYTDENKNAFLDGKGNLVIEARKEPTKGKDGIARDYSSARLRTEGTFSQRYGKFEARMKMPRGQGIWPAFWMMGVETSKKGWPGGGEIDIMEFLGHQLKTVYGTTHSPGHSGGGGISGKYETGVDLSQDFHIYGVEWDPAGIRWYFDGIKYATVIPEDVKGNQWPFDKPFYMILNLAVGGNWPGYPNETTVFPQRLLVDWIRAYRDKDLQVDEAKIAAAHQERMKRHTGKPAE